MNNLLFFNLDNKLIAWTYTIYSLYPTDMYLLLHRDLNFCRINKDVTIGSAFDDLFIIS